MTFNAARAQTSTKDNNWKWKDALSGTVEAAAYFQCPKCSHVESSSCKSFQTVDLDIKQKCNACLTSSNVVKWKCKCNTLWHRCPVHRYTKNQSTKLHELNPNGRISNKSRPDERERKINRLRGPIPYEELLDKDLTNAKRSREDDEEWIALPTITIGTPKIKQIRVSSLGPVLKKRFIHPGYCQRLDSSDPA